MSKTAIVENMGRKAKIGLEYFPFDVDFFQDIKIRKLIKYQGGKAATIYVLLLCNIYKEGYYIRWDEELPFIISEQTGFDEAYIREVIACCLKVDLFDKNLFDGQKVLTSASIQKRYNDISNSIRRKTVVEDYSLLEPTLDFSSEPMPISSEEIRITSVEMPQSKLNEIKEKETMDIVISTNKHDKETRAQVFYAKLVPFLSSYSPEMLREFYDYWTESNENGRKMRFECQKIFDISKRLATWKRNERIRSRYSRRNDVTIQDAISSLSAHDSVNVDNVLDAKDAETIDFKKLIGI